MKPYNANLPLSESLNDKSIYCYGAYELDYWLIDNWGQGRQSKTLFYTIDQKGSDIVLGIPGLRQLKIFFDPEAEQWRFKVNVGNLRVEEPNTFIKNIETEPNVFAIMCAAISRGEQENGRDPELSQELLKYNDVFSNNMANTLLIFKEGDHAIEIEEGKSSPYKPLYNLSQTELSKLRRYLENALHKRWIRHSIFSAGAPILFVSKKDDGLRLCVDYKGLNAVTIKNRHPLPLIIEILDRLCGAKIFTKLDLKNAYHRIRIRSGDE